MKSFEISVGACGCLTFSLFLLKLLTDQNEGDGKLSRKKVILIREKCQHASLMFHVRVCALTLMRGLPRNFSDAYPIEAGFEAEKLSRMYTSN